MKVFLYLQMCSYLIPRSNVQEKKREEFNYRLSRARRCAKNAFMESWSANLIYSDLQ
ncbi:hypothetical protein EAI_16973 [Harpegnathos saltator]|uniref:Uncharacterized protein n=1 Tax=Harpegnathos saltator TaxID=610380 RepID=E2B9T7_HARSA|nr:hypothetical protein EAI_16973 [Harpegnathos saltator]